MCVDWYSFLNAEFFVLEFSNKKNSFVKSANFSWVKFLLHFILMLKTVDSNVVSAFGQSIYFLKTQISLIARHLVAANIVKAVITLCYNVDDKEYFRSQRKISTSEFLANKKPSCESLHSHSNSLMSLFMNKTMNAFRDFFEHSASMNVERRMKIFWMQVEPTFEQARKPYAIITPVSGKLNNHIKKLRM